MKNKRSKNSIYYNSIKNKSRKQEQIHNIDDFYTFNQLNFSPKPSKNKRKPFIKKVSTSENFRTRSTTGVGSFFIDDDEPVFGPNYRYKKEQNKKIYRFGFTNSKFIHFLGHLTPKEYLMFITLIALIISEDLNETEAKIIYAFISNVADTMQTIVEQEIILSKYKHEAATVELNDALQNDFEIIYKELEKLKKKLPTN